MQQNSIEFLFSTIQNKNLKFRSFSRDNIFPRFLVTPLCQYLNSPEKCDFWSKMDIWFFVCEHPVFNFLGLSVYSLIVEMYIFYVYCKGFLILYYLFLFSSLFYDFWTSGLFLNLFVYFIPRFFCASLFLDVGILFFKKRTASLRTKGES